MASLKRVTVVAIAVVLVAAAAMAGTAEAQQQTCANKLVPCADYLNGTKPSSECCDSIKEAVAKELPCLCNLYNTPGIFQSFNVTVEQALNVTRNCGVPVNLNECNATTPSPQAQPPPAASGSDNNGLERAVLAGLCTVFLFFVSTLFY